MGRFNDKGDSSCELGFARGECVSNGKSTRNRKNDGRLMRQFCPNRYSVAVDNVMLDEMDHEQSYICISDNSNTLCVDVNGKVIGGLVDNYATGGQPGKEQTSYRKEPIVTAIIYPDAKSAVMIEKNRVMRFDTLDPNDRFVAHIKFPHPVEDMFLFYESLNAEPLMYLFPKIQQEEE